MKLYEAGFRSSISVRRSKGRRHLCGQSVAFAVVLAQTFVRVQHAGSG